MRVYQAVPENVGAFNRFFQEHLLPVQLRHGAELIGRWVTDDSRVVAIWKYENTAHYERVQAAVRTDPDSQRAQKVRASLPKLFSNKEEWLMSSTLESSDAG